MADEEIPRLFYLAPGYPEPTPGAERVADGVQWPDDSISVRWRDRPGIESWDSWAAATVEADWARDGSVTVVWRLQEGSPT